MVLERIVITAVFKSLPDAIKIQLIINMVSIDYTGEKMLGACVCISLVAAYGSTCVYMGVKVMVLLKSRTTF